ncbi:MAG: hypothetical protein M3040_01845 [Bacteroidota bacterium]|nr:hypothetical protein [Bacteroidota bacterium]
MKRTIALMLIVFTLFAAYSSKPDDKTCIIEAVKFVWGNNVPDLRIPLYYEQFMDLTSKSVVINDWIFLKRISYRFTKETKTVGFGVFKKVVPVRF